MAKNEWMQIWRISSVYLFTLQLSQAKSEIIESCRKINVFGTNNEPNLYLTGFVMALVNFLEIW